MTGSQAGSAEAPVGLGRRGPAEIDAALRALHGVGPARDLSRLHVHAAELVGADAGARRFHLTHAWVFALEAGDTAESDRLEAALRALGGL